MKSTDVLLPSALETNINYFITYPECSFIAGGYSIINNNGKVIHASSEKIKKDHYLTLLQFNHVGPLSPAMFKCEIFDYIGLFDENLHTFADYDLYLRVVKDFSMFHHDEEIVRCRKYDQESEVDLTKDLWEIRQVYQKHKTRIPTKDIRGILRYIKRKIKKIYNVLSKVIYKNKRYAWFEDDIKLSVKRGQKFYKTEYAILALEKIKRQNNSSVFSVSMMKTALFLLFHNPVILSSILIKKGR